MKVYQCGRLVVSLLTMSVATAGIVGCSDSRTEPISHVSAVNLSLAHDSLFFGRTTRITATVVGDSTIGANPQVAWTSSDTSVAIIDSAGTVLGVGVGSASLSAKFGERTSAKTIRVVLQRADGGVVFAEGSTADIRTCAISTDAAVYCRPLATAADSVPHMVKQPGAAGEHFTSVQGANNTTCALATDGRIKCWGDNGHWTYARSGVVKTDTGPVAVNTALRFNTFTHGGHEQTCGAAQPDNVVYCWGHNDGNQLGHGESGLSANDSMPKPVIGNLKATALATNQIETCLLDLAGAAFCAGGFGATRTVLGIEQSILTADGPMPVSGGLRFASIYAGDTYQCGITASSDAYCWGENFSGRLGIGLGATWPIPFGPQRVLGNLKFASITTIFRDATCGLTTDGDVYCWGSFVPSAISARAGEQTLRPFRLKTGAKFKALTHEVKSMCGIATDGKVLCWN